MSSQDNCQNLNVLNETYLLAEEKLQTIIYFSELKWSFFLGVLGTFCCRCCCCFCFLLWKVSSFYKSAPPLFQTRMLPICWTHSQAHWLRFNSLFPQQNLKPWAGSKGVLHLEPLCYLSYWLLYHSLSHSTLSLLHHSLFLHAVSVLIPNDHPVRYPYSFYPWICLLKFCCP